MVAGVHESLEVYRAALQSLSGLRMNVPLIGQEKGCALIEIVEIGQVGRQ
jgi:hypothetical protein